jgi:hypothetical protein
VPGCVGERDEHLEGERTQRQERSGVNGSGHGVSLRLKSI